MQECFLQRAGSILKALGYGDGPADLSDLKLISNLSAPRFAGPSTAATPTPSSNFYVS